MANTSANIQKFRELKKAMTRPIRKRKAETVPDLSELLKDYPEADYFKNKETLRGEPTSLSTFDTVLDKVLGSIPEMHIPGYSYCGPGTKLNERINSGSAPINELDSGCLQHDVDYTYNTTSRAEADKKLVQLADKVLNNPKASMREKAEAGFVKTAFEIKNIDSGSPGEPSNEENINPTNEAASDVVQKGRLENKVGEVFNAAVTGQPMPETSNLTYLLEPVIKTARAVVDHAGEALQIGAMVQSAPTAPLAAATFGLNLASQIGSVAKGAYDIASNVGSIPFRALDVGRDLLNGSAPRPNTWQDITNMIQGGYRTTPVALNTEQVEDEI